MYAFWHALPSTFYLGGSLSDGVDILFREKSVQQKVGKYLSVHNPSPGEKSLCWQGCSRCLSGGQVWTLERNCIAVQRRPKKEKWQPGQLCRTFVPGLDQRTWGERRSARWIALPEASVAANSRLGKRGKAACEFSCEFSHVSPIFSPSCSCLHRV